MQKLAVYIVFLLFLVSCSSYKQNIMYRVGDSHVNNPEQEIWAAEKNYVIQPNDLLSIEVFTKGGESILDPQLELGNQSMYQRDNSYMVNEDGFVNLPRIGLVELKGLSLTKAEISLQEKFTSLYNALYVKIKFESKRVVVLGASGGQVIPLYYPGTRLSEIVALAGGVNLNGKAHNIRVLRGDDIIVADLSTVKGYKETNIIMQPDDIVYIETVRKPFIESVRDYSPLLSIATSIISITALIIGLR